MHMTDALLSPIVGGAFLAVSAGAIAYSAHRVTRETEERQVPLMGVLGAFVFAAQMINFSIPGTGSSGHLGGGMLLAILLGPYAAFLVLSSVLVVQALFFADGGILALGTNIFNLGIWPCFLGLLIYRLVAGGAQSRLRHWTACIVAVIVSLELGALGVVFQTLLSGRSDLPIGRFALLMMGIHLPIAVVEGIITVGVVEFVRSIRPGAVEEGAMARTSRGGLVPATVSLAALAVLVGCVLAWFASAHPDGLEWALERVGWTEASEAAAPAKSLAQLQEKTAILPDYDFPTGSEGEPVDDSGTAWPVVSAGTSVAGLVGGLITFGIVCLIGFGLYLVRSRNRGNGPRILQVQSRSLTPQNGDR